jgi:hypothetical protein
MTISSLKDGKTVSNKDFDTKAILEWIAWLEKQGELVNSLSKGLDNAHERIDGLIQKNNSLIEQLEKQGEQKPVIIIPKFRVGDKIRRKTPRQYDKDMQVSRIESNYYICNHLGKFSSELIPFSEESNYELVEHNPAETEKGTKGNEREIPNSEQKQDVNTQINPSEYINDMGGNGCYLKNTKQQLAWCEGDEYCIHQLIVFCENCMVQDDGAKRCAQWLKSLKERYAWKPSDEQMNTLEYYMHNLVCTKHKEILFGLYSDLKKLKE